MALVTLKEVLEDAQKNKYAVGMFDVHNLEMVRAVIEAAEQEQSPVIMALAEVHVKNTRDIEEIANIMVHAAKKAKVPVVVHYDHGTNLDYILQVLKCGFSSVMYDGSVLPIEENKKNTKEVVRLAHLFGASVEAELGHVGQGEGGEDDGCEMIYTDPKDAVAFAKETKIDALAVAIGTVHGVYHSEPKLDLERLDEIHRLVDVPLVLHGGSGLSDEDFRNCIQNGISKVNIYTEVVQTVMQGIWEILETGEKVNYPELMESSKEVMKQVITSRLRVFGSNQKVK